MIDDAGNSFKNALLSMDRSAAGFELRRVWENGGQTPASVEAVIRLVLEDIGNEWERGDLSLAQVYMSGVLCEELVAPFLPERGSAFPSDKGPRMAIAVLEDRHTLGKRLVSSALHAEGYFPTDYGAGMTAERIAERATEEGVEVLQISTLMLHAALKVADLRKRLESLGAPTRIIVGGAPFRLDESLWREVGAHAFGPTAHSALSLMHSVGVIA